MTRLAVVIGDPIHHSVSPTIVNAAFTELGLDWKMITLQVPEGKVDMALELMRDIEMPGMSVTMPHKKVVAGMVDEMDSVASTLGAVNCVSLVGTKLVGHNTDGSGFLAGLSNVSIDVSDSKILVFGAGGAAAAVANACILAGALKVSITARSKAEELAQSLGCEYELTPNCADFDILVNATPLGMESSKSPELLEKSPVSQKEISPNHIIVDLVYNPRETKFMKLAQEEGALVIGGLPMLVGQAAEAVKLWTGKAANLEIMTNALS